jgi:hypothetical protein
VRLSELFAPGKNSLVILAAGMTAGEIMVMYPVVTAAGPGRRLGVRRQVEPAGGDPPAGLEDEKLQTIVQAGPYFTMLWWLFSTRATQVL